MKFKVTMKDPDTLIDAIRDAAWEAVGNVAGVHDSEKKYLAENRSEELSELASRWFEYGEYLTVEIDTEAQSIRVVPVKE